MDIRNSREIRQTARYALDSARGNPRQVVLVYGGITCLLSLISTLITYYLNSEIANTGGLSNMGLRSVLTTLSLVLPYAQIVISMGLMVGYQSAMLYAARGGTADLRTLRQGFRRIVPLISATIWQGLIYTGIVFLAVYASAWIFAFFPGYSAFMETSAPIVEAIYATGTAADVDPAILYAALEQMLPMLVIFALLSVAALIPVSYLFRMSIFCIIDAERPGGLAALRESRRMMRRNRMNLFRLDLGFWWYYLLQTLVGLVAYGDVLLPMAGITLPFSDTVSYFLFLILYLALQLVIYCCFMNRVTVTYATAYEALRPKPQAKGVALGSIFDM